MFIKKPLNFAKNNSRLVTIALLLLALVGAIWGIDASSSPQRVWNSMLGNNLKTTSFTRTITQEDSSGKIEQIVQLFFGPKVFVNTRATVLRTSKNGQSLVQTQTLGTTDADYLRYTELIAANQQPDTKPVLNVWGKQNKNQNDSARTGRFLQEAILGVVPIGNLPEAKRKELLDFINSQNCYKIDFKAASKKTVDGRQAYEYQVAITPESYAKVLNKYTELIGLGVVKGINPEDFANLPDVKTKITVDILSRQIVSLVYEATGRAEQYSSFGLQKSLDLPKDAIAFNELQKRLQSLR